MNGTFSGRRFLSYAAKQYIENHRNYLYAALGILLALLVINGKTAHGNYSGMERDIYRRGAVIGITFMVIMLQFSMRPFMMKPSQIMAHLAPASDFEKYLFTWANSIIIVPIVYIGIFLLSIVTMNIVLDRDISMDIFGKTDLQFIITALAIHAFALFSNAMAKNNPIWGYIVTGLALFLFLYVLLLPAKLGWINSTGGSVVMPNVVMNPYIGDIHYYVSWLPFAMVETFNTISAGVLTVFFWVTGYFKFRERQLK